jgi:Histidine phosphatase superfamily (branch 1)
MTILAIWMRDDWRRLPPEVARPTGCGMKTLFLIRHAKSSWGDTALPDKDRPLDDRGKRDAPKMGKRLAKRDVKPDLIVVRLRPHWTTQYCEGRGAREGAGRSDDEVEVYRGSNGPRFATGGR